MSPGRLKSSKSSQRTSSRIAVVVATIVLLTVTLFLALRPGAKQTLMGEAVHSAGHFGMFGAMALLLCLLVPLFIKSWREERWRAMAAAATLAMGLGLFVEIAQQFIPGRSPSWNDLLQDGLGVVAGLLLLLVVDPIRSSRPALKLLGRFAFPVFLALLTVGIWPFASCTWDFFWRNRSFPILIDFQANWSNRFLWRDDSVQVSQRPVPSDWPAAAGQNVIFAKIANEDQFPGLGVREPYPDWHQYETLAFDIYSLQNETIEMAVRVHDFEHDDSYQDRFGRLVNVAPGYQTFRIRMSEIQFAPRNRRMNLTSIDGVKVFAVRPTSPLSIWLGNIRLERE